MIRDLTKQSKTNVDFFFFKFEINLHLMINIFLSLQWGNAKKQTKKVDGLDRRSEGARLFITAGIENHLESPTTAMNPVG